MGKHRGDWRNYLRLGINHHLLYPAVFESTIEHRDTIGRLLDMPQFDVVDMFVPEDGELLRYEADLVRRSGKSIVYNCPLMTGLGRNPHSPDAAVREATQYEVQRHVDRARQLGASTMVVASGADPGSHARAAQTELFISYLTRLCQYAAPDIELLIEPFDRSIGKCLLIGPTTEAVDVVKRVRRNGAANIGLLVDMGHVPLMNETFSEAVRTAAPYMKHIHLGSCVMRNEQDPLYGDMHPPWGYAGGENDVPELAAFLQELMDCDYLHEGGRRTVTFEMRPYPGKSEEESIALFFKKWNEAWRKLS